MITPYSSNLKGVVSQNSQNGSAACLFLARNLSHALPRRVVLCDTNHAAAKCRPDLASQASTAVLSQQLNDFPPAEGVTLVTDPDKYYPIYSSCSTIRTSNSFPTDFRGFV
jgi:hypothetical protein